MTRSANEVAALAAKAARGAGAPPAQATEFGRAALCHLCAGRDPADLRAALEVGEKGPILALPLAFARVLTRAQEGIAEGEIGTEGGASLVQSYAEALIFAHRATLATGVLKLRVEIGKPASRALPARVEMPDDLAALMFELASRTFVPESEASRLSGAGAGLTDND